MKFSLTIDNISSYAWELNIQEAYLFSWIYTLPSWADKTVINGSDYFFSSRHKVIEELPILTDKPDTVYRYFKKLEEKGLILLQKIDSKDYVSITEKGKKWNSHEPNPEKNPSAGNYSEGRKKIRATENNPGKLGKKSENNSENFPTYNNTSINTTTTIIQKEEEVEKVDFDELEDAELGETQQESYPAFVEEERKKLKEAIAADHQPELGDDDPRIEELKQFGRQMWKSELLVETVCKVNSIQLVDFQSYLQTFIAEKIIEEKFSKSYSDAKSHFMNWVRLRHENVLKSSKSVQVMEIPAHLRMKKI
ncbi:hypothetical protein [Dyadobacter sp. LHD-138]|uniref:DUF7833 domain-containing protein n=1 Tax=Dyadobacter sp. LHD-138 TaxID=3071413 RepID=UPI0027DF39E5|nr:hypothetical protein [Dyadobacter sp. LHD-138]MDQ6477825.1 hypothetical protein [Dyadobacter sp. LHD-138]